ncbi:MAG TPA: TIGR04222 domain-containing membrane protein [Verrucomicrobiae bacterium]|jgi:uncharacterized protein (TIGR04222 family)|nr:TIGR04222 domain-containing membrane protein [Verrucomicrobiae bacterium]
MNFWQDNVIGNMYGPMFLALYALVIGVVLAVSRWRMWSADRTQEERVDDPPEPVSATDIAQLRGNLNEVLRLTVVELVQRGYLLVVGSKIFQASTAPDPRHLSRLQRPVFDFFKSPRKPAALFSDKSLKEWFRAECSGTEKNLEQYRLITPDDVKQQSRRVAFLSGLIVLGLGAYKLVVALSKGKTNVGFLVIMAIFGIIAVFLVSRAPRMSRRGKSYLAKQRARYFRLKSEISRLAHPIDDSGLIFAVALFGISTLNGTPYANLVSTFQRAASSSGGVGCGGASCGGAGCGGGGCGGGGCGGCGGGS